MATRTSMRSADMISGDACVYGVDSDLVRLHIKNIIDMGVTGNMAAEVANLIFAVYLATKEKYGLTLGTKENTDGDTAL